MRAVITLLMLLLCDSAIAASAYWTGIRAYTYGRDSENTRNYSLFGDIHGENGEYAGILSDIYGHMENGQLYLKHMDFSQESLDPTFNWWALALCGDIVSKATFTLLTAIEDFYSNDLYTGGTPIESPGDFYMAFKASEVLIGTDDYEEGQTWYGWVHVSVDENLEMTLLGEGINLYGGAVTVGAVPEPAAGLLLLAGSALLVLKRRWGLDGRPSHRV